MDQFNEAARSGDTARQFHGSLRHPSARLCTQLCSAFELGITSDANRNIHPPTHLMLMIPSFN